MRSSDPDSARSRPDAATGKQPTRTGGADGGSVGDRSHSSSWRYASASVGGSADSDTYSGLMGSVAAEEVTLAGGGAGPHGGALTQPPADAATHQLWSPTKRPQMAPQPLYDLQAAPAGGLGVPPGMDAASYAAGERAAFMRAFQQALPGQQALGQLFTAVDSLHARLEEEAAQWRQLQLGASKTSGLVESVLQRLDTLEFMRLPQLQERAEEAAGRPPEQLIELLGSLSQVVTLLGQQRQLLAEQQQRPPPRPRSIGALHWLLLAAAGYGQSVLSRADVAALFLSRKILLVEEAGGAGAQPGGSRSLGRALSVALFVGSVEAAWQLQHRALRPLPAFAQRAAAPLGLGLRVARAAVWSAALVMAAAQTRASCHAAGDSACAALEAAAASLKLPAWVHQLPGWQYLQAWQGNRAASTAAATAAAEGTAADPGAAGKLAGGVPERTEGQADRQAGAAAAAELASAV